MGKRWNCDHKMLQESCCLLTNIVEHLYKATAPKWVLWSDWLYSS